MYDLIRWLAEDRRAQAVSRWVGRLLPRRMGLALFSTLGWLLFCCAKKLRRHVLANMRDLLGSVYAPPELRRAAVRYLRNVTATLAEVLIYAEDPALIEAQLTIEGQSRLNAALDKGRGAILYTSHSGNFFYSYLYLSRRFPALIVVTGADPTLRGLFLRFQRLGCAGLDYDATPPVQLVRRLRQHLQAGGVVVLMGDFYRDYFPPAELFGRPTRGLRGAASLALDLGTPVIPFYGYRQCGGEHRLVFEAEADLGRFGPADKAAAGRYLNSYLERFIINQPGDWFYWFNCDERWLPNTAAAAQREEIAI